MDVEENVEIMVAAFILVGLILVIGYVAVQKSGFMNKVGITEAQLKEIVPEEQYDDTLGVLYKKSAGWGMIVILIGIAGLVAFYLIVKENW